MSLQGILKADTQNKKWSTIYANSITTDEIVTNSININGNDPVSFFDIEVTNLLKVDGLADIGGDIFQTEQGTIDLRDNINLGQCTNTIRWLDDSLNEQGKIDCLTGGMSLYSEGTLSLRFTNTTMLTEKKIQIGTVPNHYILPDTSLGATSNDVLTYDQILKTLSFKKPSGYIIGFGGNMETPPKLADVWGDGNRGTINSLGPRNQHVVPISSNLYCMSYNTTSGDNTSSMRLFINGVAYETFTLNASNGVHIFVPILINQGDTLSLRALDIGATLGVSTFSIYVT